MSLGQKRYIYRQRADSLKSVPPTSRPTLERKIRGKVLCDRHQRSPLLEYPIGTRQDHRISIAAEVHGELTRRLPPESKHLFRGFQSILAPQPPNWFPRFRKLAPHCGRQPVQGDPGFREYKVSPRNRASQKNLPSHHRKTWTLHQIERAVRTRRDVHGKPDQRDGFQKSSLQRVRQCAVIHQEETLKKVQRPASNRI
jgi:hypothetical protein